MTISSSFPTVLVAVANSRTGLHLEQSLRCCFDVVTTTDFDRATWILREQAPVQSGLTLVGETPDHPVDLVLIEYGGNFNAALDFLRSIKASGELHTIPVVFISSDDDPTRELYALEQGAADFWTMQMSETVLLARAALHAQRSRRTKKLARYSMLDDSTGAASRRLFERDLHVEWRRSVREKSWMSLAFVAMDGYETYAERLGYESVEECMQMLAQALNICLRRPGDMLSRLSGDMFAALLPVTDSRGAPVVLQQMFHSVAGLQLAFPGSVARLKLTEHVSISIGTVSAAPGSPERFERFAQSAYSALGLAMADGPWGLRQHFLQESDETLP